MFSSHFSTAAVHKLEPLLHEKVNQLLTRLGSARGTGEPVPLWHAFSALTADIITSYCLPESYNHLSSPDYASTFHEVVNRTSLGTHVVKQFPYLMPLLRRLPRWLSRLLYPDMAVLVDMQCRFTSQIANLNAEIAKSDDIGGIFTSMLEAHVPQSERSTQRLAQEAQVLVLAGTLTTAHTLMTTTYHILTNPSILSRLRAELQDAGADAHPLPLAKLEQLPYLTAVIHEGLRLGTGVPGPLQRVSSDTTLQFKDLAIPPGTPVSMSALLQHNNPSIFPSPETFHPQRWLPLGTEGRRLQKYLVSFSKGSRQCIGMNLAYGELYLTLAALVWRFGGEMEMWGTVFERDVQTRVDAFNPLPALGSKGLRVVIGGMLESDR
jgi:cytochrome P450